MKRYSMFTYLIALVLPLTLFVSTGHTNTYIDHFDTGIDSFYWTIDLNNPTSSVTWDSVNKRVLMTQGLSYSGDGRWAGLVFNFPGAGDLEVKVDYTLVNWPYNIERSGLLIVVGGGFVSSIERDSDASRGGEVYLTNYLGTITPVSTTDSTGTLRFLRTGQTLQGYYWNGTGWTLIATSPHLQGHDMVFEMAIWPVSGTGGTAGVQVAFDNFYLHSDTIYSCPGDFAPVDCDVDGSDLAALIANTSLLDLATFAKKFGKSDCP